MKIALHVHSTASDGQLSIEELLKKANDENVSLLSVCDHETAHTRKEISTLNFGNVTYINSCELSAEQLSNFHILGYNIQNPEYLASIYGFLSNTNHLKNLLIVDKLMDQGIDISPEKVLKVTGMKRLDKISIKQYLTQMHYAENTKEAHEKYIGKKTPNYVKMLDFNASLIIKLITACGGVPVLAHPAKIKTENGEITNSQLDSLIKQLVPSGLRGIEVYNANSDTKNAELLSSIADKYGLIKTEGTDFHNINHLFYTNLDYMDLKIFFQALKDSKSNYSVNNLCAFHKENVKPIVDCKEKSIKEDEIESEIIVF